MRLCNWAIALAVAVLPSWGCDNGPLPDPPPDVRPIAVADGCQALLAEPAAADPPPTSACIAPYPSDFHRVPDAASKTGFKGALRGAARPKRRDGAESDPHAIVPIDGASLIPTIVAGLAGDIVRDGLPGVLEDPTKSTRPDSATVLLESDTGKLTPHYTDIVDRKDGTHTPLVMRTFAPLKPRTRYVVGIQGAKALPPEGSASTEPALAKPPTGFRRLRDRVTTIDPALATIAPRFDAEVFGPLERAGIARERLQLAWDFTTGTAEEPTLAMLRVRELTMAWYAANDPAPKVVASRPGPASEPEIDTILTIEMTAPLFLDSAKPGAHLFRDASGQVTQNGTTTFRATVVVPKVITGRADAGRALAYGHGFFGDTVELEGEGARKIAERTGSVLFGVDWWGMSKDDFVGVADALTNAPEHVTDFAERVHQAMANWMVLTHAMATGGALAKVPELHRGGQIGNALLWDPSFVAYFGASQGHILGGTLAALDPDFSRVVLNVGGGGFTHMMPRSLNFGPFALLLAATFPDPLLVQSFIAMFQRPLDRIDPVTYAPMVIASPLPGSAADRRVLFQTGLGDAQVPNAGSFLHARAMGLGQTMPTKLEVFGIGAFGAPATSGMTIFDYGIDTKGYALAQPLEPNPVHGSVRLNPKALAQMEAFVKPNGVVIHPCDGPCDPE